MRKQTKILLTVMLSACISLGGCYKEDEVSDLDIFTVKNSADSIEADGVSRVVISVELPTEVTSTKRAVTFTATKGLFEIENKNTISITASDIYTNSKKQVIASASLVSTTDEGPCIVTIKSQTYLKQNTIKFIRAFADQIVVSVDKLNLKADGNTELAITTQLKRGAGRGKVSASQPVKLNVYDQDNNIIGAFRNKTLIVDADGKCVNYFSIPASTNYTGQIKIIASAAKSYSAETSDTALVNVIK